MVVKPSIIAHRAITRSVSSLMRRVQGRRVCRGACRREWLGTVVQVHEPLARALLGIMVGSSCQRLGLEIGETWADKVKTPHRLDIGRWSVTS